MKALSVLVLVGILACVPETVPSSDGGGTAAPAKTAEPEASLPAPSHDHDGSMCDLYETVEAEFEDGVAVPVPTLCEPFYLYDGYPADRPGEEFGPPVAASPEL